MTTAPDENPRALIGVILAAGLSTRMGQPKMVLPWGQTTVIGQVITTLRLGGINELLVVTGGAQAQVGASLVGMNAKTRFNPNYGNGEMLTSIQTGLGALGPPVEAALIALGDQPQIQADVVRKVIQAACTKPAGLIVPSYKMRRGHPWLIRRELWAEVLNLHPPETLRDFMRRHAGDIYYLIVDTPSIVQDLDTPEDYSREKP
jgi:molybdenum cofactor cytidylyltransferase